jgi:hypothetical protein
VNRHHWRARNEPAAFAGQRADAFLAALDPPLFDDVEGPLAAGLRPVWLDRWNDRWEPPAGVVRASSLTDLTALVS